MSFQKNRTAAELISKIKQIEEVIELFYGANAITFRVTNRDEHGPNYKVEQCSAQTIESVWLLLAGHENELLTELETLDPDGKNALIKETASKIDPATAQIFYRNGDPFDPYGIGPELPNEHQQIKEVWYVAPPGSQIWVWVGDLPDKTRQALRLKLAKDRADELAWIAKCAKASSDRDSSASPLQGGYAAANPANSLSS